MLPLIKVSDNFMLGKTPVTQAQWIEIMGDNPSHFKGDDLPVEKISWYDAIDFCNKLSMQEGLLPAYTIDGETVTHNGCINGYRLPTGEEWTYAARGGELSKGYTYAGSDDPLEVAWFDKNSDSKTRPVASKKPNELGLYDMSGNVWEWCWDCLGDDRVARGGGWSGVAGDLRVALRCGGLPELRFNDLGFRLLRPIFTGILEEL